MSNSCELCKKVFEFPYLLERHKNRKTPCNIIKSNYDCKLCHISFDHESRLETHNKSKKHINNYNIQIANNVTNIIDNNFNNTSIIEDKLKLQNEYEEKLSKELQLKEDIYKTEINMLQKENELLKFNFEENIKINFDNEVGQELVPISTTIITHKTLNKIDITDILTKYSKLLDITDLLYIINYDLNKLYIDKFWNNIESEDWIYLDEELINWFGYKELLKGKEKIVKFLKNEFEIEDDYKILNNEEYINSIENNNSFNSPAAGELKYGPATKHILIKSDCFKNICMLVGTIKSKEIQKYFIEVEKIFKFYLKYTSEFNKYELEKSKLIKNIYINKTELKLDSILYLITTINKAKENIFKFGSTINEKSRKTSYNTGNVEAEKFFYVATYNCYDAITLEKRIAKLLINFKIPNESEMYQLHFTALDNIIKEACKNDNDSLNKINKFISEEYNNYINLEPIKF
jgi:phage anti-repressor protein